MELYFAVPGLDMSKTSGRPDLMGQITPVGGPPGPSMAQIGGQMPMMGGTGGAQMGQQMPMMGGAGGAQTGQQMPMMGGTGGAPVAQQPMGMGYMGMGGQMAGLFHLNIC